MGIEKFLVFLARHDAFIGMRAKLGVLVQHSLIVCDEQVGVLPADEFLEIVQPRVGDAGTVRDDEHVLESHAMHQVVCGQRLAEARLGVPEELFAAIVEIALSHLYCGRLLVSQRVGGARVDVIVAVSEPDELVM